MINEDEAASIPSNLLSTLKQDSIRVNTCSHKGFKAEKKVSNVKLPPLSIITTQLDNSPGNLWNHQKQRQKLKYLTDSTQCVCGAGRDISFLYDASNNGIRVAPPTSTSAPESLVPNEYHVVKHSGVLGLDLFDDPYSAIAAAHERHDTKFPSMRPTGRQEVMQLKNTLDQMIGKVGLESYIKHMELTGPTQMHNLIHLVKKEQEVYNICFHELIRQVSVHCSERGALLAEVRQCYSNLLNKIPHQVRSLHDEVVAQRALDRKLTTELCRFHQVLTKLTCDLCELRDHNELAGEEIEETKESLLLALSESEKNANLLVEYSNLYELQRSRLENQIEHLSKEKELWEQTCYYLAVEVANHYQLESVRQLQLSGKSWEKLASHFAILFSDKNTKQLCIIQQDVQKWRRDLALFLHDLKNIEGHLITELMAVYDSMNSWLLKLKGFKESASVPTDVMEKMQIEELWQALTNWLTVLNQLSEIFSGETLMNRIDKLQLLEHNISGWNEIALSILQRRVQYSVILQGDAPVGAKDAQKESVTELMSDVTSCMKALSLRTSGENGIAVAFVRLITPLESWDTTFNLILHSGKSFNESTYLKLTSQLDQWLSHISVALDGLSSLKIRNENQSFDDILSKADKWCSVFCHGVQVDDSHVMEQVSHLYGSIMQWMTQILLTITKSKSDFESVDIDSKCKVLCENLAAFTEAIVKSCHFLFENEELPEIQDIIDEETGQLQTLQDEAKNWIRLSKIMTELEEREKIIEKVAQEKKQLSPPKEDAILTIGIDDNIREATEQIVDKQFESQELDLYTEKDLPEGRGGQPEETEKLVVAMDELNSKLSTVQVEVTAEKERADKAERLLQAAESHIEQLMSELKQIKEESIEQASANKKGRRARTKSRDIKML